MNNIYIHEYILELFNIKNGDCIVENEKLSERYLYTT